MEYDRTPSAIRDDLCETDFELTLGYLTVPNGPGLGIEVSEKLYENLVFSIWQKFNTDW